MRAKGQNNTRSEHMHCQTFGVREQSKVINNRIRLSVEIPSSLQKAFKRKQAELGCDKSVLIRAALEHYVSPREAAFAENQRENARSKNELLRLIDLGFLVLASMRQEPLLCESKAPLVDYCRAVLASAKLDNLKSDLAELLRLVVILLDTNKITPNSGIDDDDCDLLQSNQANREDK